MRYARRVATRGVLNGVVKYDLRTPCMVEGRIGGRIYEGRGDVSARERKYAWKIYGGLRFFFSFCFRVDSERRKRSLRNFLK